jgi:MGT family glycosyltransferase
MFQGGGNIPLIMPIVGELVARGHRVRVLAGPGIRDARLPVSARFRERIAAAGAELVAFPEPEVHPFDAVPTPGPAREEQPPVEAAEARRARVLLWAPAWADAVARELEREPADVVAADFELLGALCAAEARGVPAAALVHTVPWRPLPGVPARGPRGDRPEPTAEARARDGAARARWTAISVADGLPPVNLARARAGLAPLLDPFQQYDRAERVLVLAPAAFDFPANALPGNVRYVGTPFDDAGAPPWAPPWPADDARPLVVASLSTLQQGQEPLLHRVCEALGTLPVRALVTVGPALDPGRFPAAPNMAVESFVPHAAVLPRAAAMVTQCGLGTVMKALAQSVPLVCIPLVGDQADNAARVVAQGAGVRLPSDASSERIRAAVRHVLDEPRLRDGARRFAAAFAGADGARTAARELVDLVGG